jgi:60 kDa SS-A/Ro ribonucleoprotein
VNLYDLVNISHAFSPSIDKLVKGTLEVSDTRETELSANGNTVESRKRLLKEEKLGALAFIRNLRNMMQCGIEHAELALYLEKLDFKKLFPFQVIQAADICIKDCALNEKSTLYKVLDRKIHDSFDKFAKLFDGKVAIGIDNSGSMDSVINSKSKLMRDRMAAYYGVCLQEKTGGDLYSR